MWSSELMVMTGVSIGLATNPAQLTMAGVSHEKHSTGGGSMDDFQSANEQLGYYFHPPLEAQVIGYSQLDIVIRPAPTGEHFDPESFMCPILAGGELARLNVVHPWTQEPDYGVCAGEIIVENARHEQVTAFTFGGKLRVDSDSRRTLCQLVSPAPLLEHARQTFGLQEQLIVEVQIL